MNGFAAIDAFADLGVVAGITTRDAGDFGVGGNAPVGDVMRRWTTLRTSLVVSRFATATQVHGAHVIDHVTGWSGWLRGDAADGHFSRTRGIGFGVTVADCVPVFMAHTSGAIALLHSGWRGTAAGIVPHAVGVFAAHGLAPTELRLHLGPAICGRCYEVGPDVYEQIMRRTVAGPTFVDLRQVLADQARAAGVRQISVSKFCTRCDGQLFFSHRAGDGERQVAVIATELS